MKFHFHSVFRPRLAGTTVSVIGLATRLALAQSPVVDSVAPFAVRPGQSTLVTFSGQNLEATSGLWTSFPSEIVREPKSASADSQPATFRISVPPDLPIGIGVARLATPEGISNLQLLLIDDLPSEPDRGTNQSRATAQELTLPGAIDGAVAELGSDFYRVSARRGQRISVEAVAQRIGSDLDPVIRLLDEAGRELAYCDDAPGLSADACLDYSIAETGTCYVEIRDTRYRGGSKFRYRLRVATSELATIKFLPVRIPGFTPTGSADEPAQVEIEPNSKPELATKVNLPAVVTGQFAVPKDRDYFEFRADQGQRWVFLGRTRSLGSPCDLLMRLCRADDSMIAEANISGANEGSLTNSFAESGTYRLWVEELNRLGGPGLNYQIEIQPLLPGFTLSVETDKVEGPAKSFCEIKVTCVRRDYGGPITLALTGEAKGFELTNNVIPAKTNEVRLKVAIPNALTPGRVVHFSVLGYAKVGDRYLETQADTLAAVRRLFPGMLFPPTHFNGLISLGVQSPAPSAEPAAAKSL